jgi:hypothetical protein
VFRPDTPLLIILVEQRPIDLADTITKAIASTKAKSNFQFVSNQLNPFFQPAKMAEEVQQKFETLQLHAGYERIGSTIEQRDHGADQWDANSQEPDPNTKSRAVPIYATTV